MSVIREGKAGAEECKRAETFYQQRKYVEAQWLFRQSSQIREETLGPANKYTLRSKLWLARTLYMQERYSEAEQLMRQTSQGQIKTLGAKHRDTLASTSWLGRTLFKQGKYNEAEQLLRQTSREQIKTLGVEHRDTLSSTSRLGRTLNMQGKYHEAEYLLRQVSRDRESILGAEHQDTLDSKSWLGRTLNMQGKYNEAEDLLQQVFRQREHVLGAEHENTRASKFWLGTTLHKQGKYDEAEQLLLQLVRQEEEVLGVEHLITRSTRDLLARVVLDRAESTPSSKPSISVPHRLGELPSEGDDGQPLHSDAETQRTTVASNRLGELSVDGIEKQPANNGSIIQKASIPPDQSSTARIETQMPYDENADIQEIPCGGTESKTPHSDEETHKATITSSRLNEFFVGTARQTPYNDSEIQQMSILLSLINPRWGKVPRTYITLRAIGCLSLLDVFIDLGYSDHWFPFIEKSLPPCLHPSQRAQFVVSQSLVMTKSLDLEKGDKGQHCRFGRGERLPFEEKGILGTGGFGQVDRILSLISYKEYALKRVRRSVIFGGRKFEIIQQFVAEIEVLRRLKHHHVAEFVGSYTDPKYLGLLMSPVADMDLSTYLARADSTRHTELRTFFGCLARALEYLHGNSIRHKDIKPSNILVHGTNVLFTDFGLAFDFTDAECNTTSGTVKWMTSKYCAPEVASQERRNTSSDIWSLGVVFLEMITVLKGRGVESIHEFLSENGSGQAYVRTNHSGLSKLLTVLKELGHSSDNIALSWIERMLMPKHALRPTAATLIADIIATTEGSNGGFCGICCISQDDDSDAFSDVFDDLYIA